MSGLGRIYDNMMSGLGVHTQTFARLQEQMSSGFKILRPSDAPADTFQIMDIQSKSRTLGVYSENLDRIVLNLEQSSSVMQELSSLLISARGKLEGAASNIFDNTRSGMADYFDTILHQAISAANRKVLGQYIFGGDASAESAPYVAQYEDGKIVSVTYEGGSRNIRVPVGSGVEQSATFVGDNVFRSDNRSEPIFFSDTGAAAGVGTSNVRGEAWLTIVHNTTTYGGVTGVAAGTRSDDEDTIIGTSHTLTLDADNNRIKIDDGQFVNYTGAEDNLRLENIAEDVVFVDMTSLAGGLSGMIVITSNATGKLSIDDLETTVDLTAFTNNEVVTDSATGRVLYVDATVIERTGIAPVRIPGTYDLFGMLINARDVLQDKQQKLSSGVQTALIEEAKVSLDEVMGGLTGNITTAGGRLQAMDTLKMTLENIQGNLNTVRSKLQDADVIELITELSRTQTFYEMTLAATAKVLNLSLLDYL